MRTLSVATNGTKVVGSSSVEILPVNNRRSFALICNSSDVGIWLSLGVPAVIGTGIYLAPGGGSFIIEPDGLWRGSVNGIAASGTGKVVGTLELQ